MKINYEYEVGGVKLTNREAARLVQRAARASSERNIAQGGSALPVPKILQKITMQRVVR